MKSYPKSYQNTVEQNSIIVQKFGLQKCKHWNILANFYFLKVSKSASEMSISGRPQKYQKSEGANFFVFFMWKLFVLIVKIEFLKKWNFLSQCAQIIPLVGQFTTKVGDVENMPVCHINKKGKIVFVRFPFFLVRKDLHTNMAWNPSELQIKKGSN